MNGIDRSDLPGTTRRTKIVCTLGPASDTPDMIESLIKAGMNVVRINMSHGNHATHAQTIATVREMAGRYDVYIPVLMDLSGPKMRVGKIAAGSAMLRAGESFRLTSRKLEGDWQSVSINYPALVKDVRSGDHILMGDGEIELQVRSVKDGDILCEVVVGGELKSNKGLNAPGVKLAETVPTRKDLDDVAFGVKHEVDWFAQSFVRSASEVESLRSHISDSGADVPVIAKIEKKEALDNVHAIVAAADGIMIARGDLGLEVPLQQVPLIQKDVIRTCVAAAKPVITATQMLESMINNPRPTRAEAADIANAVFDGTDAMMLSAETASGSYPVESVHTMSEVVLASEGRIDYKELFYKTPSHSHSEVPEAIAHSACYTAIETDARVIICCTRSGQTALFVSNYRPPAKIAVVSPHVDTLHRTMLYWNTHPIKIPLSGDTDTMISDAKKAVISAGIGVVGDRVVIVAGVPVDVPGTTNMIKADVL